MTATSKKVLTRTVEFIYAAPLVATCRAEFDVTIRVSSVHSSLKATNLRRRVVLLTRGG